MKNKLLLGACLLLFCSCGQKQSNNYEKIMEEYAKEYYTNHMVMISSPTVAITKDMLNQAADEDDYDMSKLQKCTNSSKVVFTIENKKIIKTEFNLECE